MRILDKQFLKDKDACADGREYAKKETLLDLPIDKVVEKLIKAGKLDWANWLVSRALSRDGCMRYAIYAAKQVINIWAEKYPEDKRPQAAIKAAEKYLKSPTEKNRAAANAAYADAAAAHAANAAYAHAAATAANAAASAAYTTYAAYAAYAAADAAATANVKAAAMKIKIIRHGLKILRAEEK